MLINLDDKVCSQCLQTKSLFFFDKNSLGKDGRSAECKSCKSNRARKNYLAKIDTKYWQGKEQGITQEKYLEILNKQEGRCAICTNLFTDPKSTHLDHNHTTKQVRQFLCHQCNIGIGMFKESIDLLNKAQEYLKSHS